MESGCNRRVKKVTIAFKTANHPEIRLTLLKNCFFLKPWTDGCLGDSAHDWASFI